jgi:hypothetical protein
MAEVNPIITATTSFRYFKDYEGPVWPVAVFHDRYRHMATCGLEDKIIRLWDFEEHSVVLK